MNRIERKRSQIRKIEFGIATKELNKYLDSARQYTILDYGCGEAYQLEYLKKIGKVVCIDKYKSKIFSKEENQDVIFKLSNLEESNFFPESFDVLFSSHVLAYIKNYNDFFTELIRIGKKDSLYIFIVPSDTWMLASVVAQYWSKINAIIKLLTKKIVKNNIVSKSDRNINTKKEQDKVALKSKFKFLLSLQGHGRYNKFLESYQNFKLESWKRLLIKNGFNILKARPLLFYFPSEMYFLPHIKIKEKSKFSSSYLIITSRR